MSKSFRKDLTGQRFGRLTVIEFVSNEHPKTYWRCQCDCGETTVVCQGELHKGSTLSCGCGRYKHKQSSSRLYRIWRKMKERCTNPNHKCYSNYGGRGIIICDEWKNNFTAFYTWAMENGYTEELTIDRIDVNGNYEPLNCRWVDLKIQQWNKQKTIYVEYKGEIRNLLEVSRLTGISVNTLHTRYQRGKRGEELGKPVQSKK